MNPFVLAVSLGGKQLKKETVGRSYCPRNGKLSLQVGTKAVQGARVMRGHKAGSAWAGYNNGSSAVKVAVKVNCMST